MKRILSMITPVAGIVNIEPHPDKQPDIYFRCDLSEEIEDATRDYLWEEGFLDYSNGTLSVDPEG
jgi:hypothetical protein